MTLGVAMTLSLCSRVIGSVQWLIEVNIWVKFNENGPMGSGDMERSRNFKGKSLDL